MFKERKSMKTSSPKRFIQETFKFDKMNKEFNEEVNDLRNKEFNQ